MQASGGCFICDVLLISLRIFLFGGVILMTPRGGGGRGGRLADPAWQEAVFYLQRNRFDDKLDLPSYQLPSWICQAGFAKRKRLPRHPPPSGSLQDDTTE